MGLPSCWLASGRFFEIWSIGNFAVVEDLAALFKDFDDWL